MADLIDKIKNWLTPAPSTPGERAKSLRELGTTTRLLEQQADYAEAKAKLTDRAEKAKQRIKVTSSHPHINTRLIVIGVVLLAVIILLIVKGC